MKTEIAKQSQKERKQDQLAERRERRQYLTNLVIRKPRISRAEIETLFKRTMANLAKNPRTNDRLGIVRAALEEMQKAGMFKTKAKRAAVGK